MGGSVFQLGPGSAVQVFSSVASCFRREPVGTALLAPAEGQADLNGPIEDRHGVQARVIYTSPSHLGPNLQSPSSEVAESYFWHWVYLNLHCLPGDTARR